MSHQKHEKSVHVANAMFIKPFVAGAIAGAGEKFIMGGNNTTALYFGGAVTAGIFASGTVGALLEPAVPTATSIGSMLGKSLEHRVIEVGTSTVSAYLINKFLLKNEWKISDYQTIGKRVAIITVADIVAEMVVDSLASMGI